MMYDCLIGSRSGADDPSLSILMTRKIQQASLVACVASVATVITVILSARVLDAKIFATTLYVGMGATLVTGSAVVATCRD